MKLTKLDTYRYHVLPGLIRVELDSTNDAQAADILSELTRTDDNIYLDGEYYQFLGNSRIVPDREGTFLDLEVVQCDKRMIF